MASSEVSSQLFGDLREQVHDLYRIVAKQSSRDNATVILISFLVLLGTTRFLSGWLSSNTKALDGKPQRVPLLPYWVPVLGHIVDLVLMPDRLLKGTRLDALILSASCLYTGFKLTGSEMHQLGAYLDSTWPDLLITLSIPLLCLSHF